MSAILRAGMRRACPEDSEPSAITTSQIPRIGNREAIVERVGVLPSGTAVDWCAYFRWNDVGDPQGYGHTRDEALAELAQTWAEQIGTPDEGNASPQFDAPSEREMGRA